MSRSRACFPGAVPEEVRLSYFQAAALAMWRRRVAESRPLPAAADPDARLVDALASFLNALAPAPFDPCLAAGREAAREARRRLRGLWLEPFGARLEALPGYLARRLARHPGLSHGWRSLLMDVRSADGGGYEAARGSFTAWVVGRFRRELADVFVREAHGVARCRRTERRRRDGEAAAPWAGPRVPSMDGWGYHRLSADGAASIADAASDRELERAEARIELSACLRRLSEADRRFLEPYLVHFTEDLCSLARHWRISSAAVSKRLRRIRRTLAQSPA